MRCGVGCRCDRDPVAEGLGVKRSTVCSLLAALIGLIGYALIWQFSDWCVAVGVMCAIWGNNRERNPQ